MTRPTIAALLLALALDATAATEGPKAIPGPGDTPPAAIGVTRDGDPVLPKAYEGKVLIVTFWASWCGPCMNELPILEGVQRTAKGEVQVVAVNIEDRERFRRMYEKLKVLQVQFTHDYDKAAREAYGVNGIPHMLIVGRDGRIQRMHKGYSEKSLDGIVAEINEALAQR